MRRGTYGSYLIQLLWRPLTTRQKPQRARRTIKILLLIECDSCTESPKRPFHSLFYRTRVFVLLLPDCHDLYSWHVAWFKRTVLPRDSRDFGAFFFFSSFPVCFYYISLFLYFHWPPWYYHHSQKGNVLRVFTTLTLAECTGSTVLLSDYPSILLFIF